MKRNLLIAAVLVVGLASPSCVKRQAVSQAALIRLTKAVQGEIGLLGGGAGVTEEQMLAAIYKQNPELQAEFGKYFIQTKHDGDNVLVLVCSPDRKIGLLEDASWTLKVDRKWVQTDPKHVCAWDPSLDPQNAHGPVTPPGKMTTLCKLEALLPDGLELPRRHDPRIAN